MSKCTDYGHVEHSDKVHKQAQLLAVIRMAQTCGLSSVASILIQPPITVNNYYERHNSSGCGLLTTFAPLTQTIQLPRFIVVAAVQQHSTHISHD